MTVRWLLPADRLLEPAHTTRHHAPQKSQTSPRFRRQGLGASLFSTLQSLMDGAGPPEAQGVLQAEIAALLDASIHVFFPSTTVKVLMLADLLAPTAPSSQFHNTLLRSLLLKFGSLSLSLALIRLCLPHTPEFQGSLGDSPEPVQPITPSNIITTSTPPSFLSLLDVLLTRSEQQLQAALTPPAPASPLPFTTVLSSVQSALLTLAGHRPADPSRALYEVHSGPTSPCPPF